MRAPTVEPVSAASRLRPTPALFSGPPNRWLARSRRGPHGWRAEGHVVCIDADDRSPAPQELVPHPIDATSLAASIATASLPIAMIDNAPCVGFTHRVVFAAGVDHQESIVEQVTVSADPEAVLTGLIDSISRAFGWLDSAVLTVAANALLDPSSLEMFDREPGTLDDGDIPLAALIEDRSGSAVLIDIQAFGRSDGRFLLTTSLRHITTVVNDGFPPGLGMDYLVAALPVEIRENSACSCWSFTLDAAGGVTRELELRAAVAAANLPTAPDPARPVFACFSDGRVRYVVRDRAENGSMSDRRHEMSLPLPRQYGVLNDVAAISPEAPAASLEVGSPSR